MTNDGVNVAFHAGQVNEPWKLNTALSDQDSSSEDSNDEFETESESERGQASVTSTNGGYGDELSHPRGGMLIDNPSSILKQAKVPKI